MNKKPLPQQRYVWGRRQSRPLKEAQRQAMETTWPQVSLELPANDMIDLSKLFPNASDVWLEIGFGGGEHIATQAQNHPTVGFIGCEPFINGVASLVSQIEDKNLKNIRIVKDDARLLLARLPDQSIERIFVLFPDPWPKKRHNKRRIIQSETVETFARILKPQGRLIMATDDADYGQWMQDVMSENRKFQLSLEGRATIYDRPNNWPVTRYEKKGLAHGRKPVYLNYQLKC
jgi:tRNA (guanine-N7-)-methyltransferase